MVEPSINRLKGKARIKQSTRTRTPSRSNCTDCTDCTECTNRTTGHAPTADTIQSSAPWLPIIGGGTIGGWLGSWFGDDNGGNPIEVIPTEAWLLAGAGLAIALLL